jgi:hypothetical protein
MLRRREIIVPYAVRLGKLIPEKRVEARRAFPHLLGMIQASALLHQVQRDTDDQDRVIANRDDYRIAARLLQEPMCRLLGGGVSEQVRRFFERLAGWFGENNFTTREVKTKEETSRASVYEWLAELHRHGAVEQVEESRGKKPATWRIAEAGLNRGGNVLPTESAVFTEEA